MNENRRLSAARARLVLVALVGVTLAIGGCGSPFTLSGLLDGPDDAPLTVEPGSGTIVANKSVELTVSGGYPPYTVTMTSGEGTLSGMVYTAPANSGSVELTVSDRVGNSTKVRFDIDAGSIPLTISPSTQSIYTGQSVTFAALGGTGPFTFAVTDNQTGSPAMSGSTYTAGSTPGTDTITMTDTSDSSTVVAQITATVAPPPTVGYVIDADYHVLSAPAGGTVEPGDYSEAFVIENQGSDDGTVDIAWSVYRSSDASYDATDTLVSSGTTGSLAAYGSSGAITVTGTWPSSGNYYLIMRIVAADDIDTANNVQASGSFLVAAVVSGNSDYVVGAITTNNLTPYAGSPISESFSISNVGDTAGLSFDWQVYVSTDSTFDAGDELVDEAIGVSPLNPGDSLNVGNIGGLWPTAAGNVWLIVVISNADGVTNNNTGTVGPFAVTLPPDYAISSVTLPVETLGGNIGEKFTTIGAHTFTVQNTSTTGGTATVSWNAYYSVDTILDASDTQVASGSFPKLGANTSKIVSLSPQTTLPSTFGYYYLIFSVSASDDTNTTNNTYVSQRISVWDPVGNNETDTSGYVEYLSEAEDYSILLNADDAVQITGLTDDVDGDDDLFLVTLGASATELDMRLSWADTNPNRNNLDLVLYDSQGQVVDSSISNDVTMPSTWYILEPGPAASNWFTVTGLTPGEEYYVDVLTTTSGLAGEQYQLFIEAY